MSERKYARENHGSYYSINLKKGVTTALENQFNISELLGAFKFKGELKNVTQIFDGHINNTYIFEFCEENGHLNKYLVQEMNTYVFKDTDTLMKNVVGVTDFMHEKVLENHGDVERECLYVFFTNDNKPYYIDSEGRYWRCYNYIYNAHSCQSVDSEETFFNAAKAFGKFQCMLADYPIENLSETIPNFHNTVSRFADFKKAVADNLSGRAELVKDEIDFVLAREKDCSVLIDLLNAGELPLRVTHNDTKLNNVMFDDKTNEGICVVDLDTVMPGLSLYDFGDSIRFGANTAAEDEKDLSKVSLSLENFKAYTRGYLAAAGESLTKKEIEYLAFSSKLMTLECGMRFLGDFINGDVYFKTAYPEHNLDRCRTQFTLVADIEKKMPEMQKIVEDCCKELGIEK
ncbi:MAG: aminoglycoside phosphotransferase family protein [Clostridia bacterium]|nr:aminoglycoside phosphotransferase family protein [Clostridia bacterium]